MKNLVSLVMGVSFVFASGGMLNAGDAPSLTITILYDNYVFSEGTKADWGFACLIEGTEKTILFDTGTKPPILLHNLQKLGVNLQKMEIIAISHNHYDHTGGLFEALKVKNDVPVYMPASTPDKYIKKIEKTGAAAFREAKPKEICKHVFLTGEMGDKIKEQSLVIDSPKGLIVLTGCAHPGIVEIVEQAKKMFKNKEVYFVFGGFHLMRKSAVELEKIIERFKELGIKKIGATHCTGDKAIAAIKAAFGENFVTLGTGKIIEI